MVELLTHRVLEVRLLFLFICISVNVFDLLFGCPPNCGLSLFIEIRLTLVKQGLSIVLDKVCHFLLNKWQF